MPSGLSAKQKRHAAFHHPHALSGTDGYYGHCQVHAWAGPLRVTALEALEDADRHRRSESHCHQT